MRISVRLHYYTKKTYKDGYHPIILEYLISGVRQRKVIAKCLPDDWDVKKMRVKSKHKDSASLNNLISTKLSDAENLIYDVKSGIRPLSAIQGGGDRVTLKQAIDKELVRLEKEFKSGLYDKVKGLENQIKDTSVALSDIDTKWFDSLISDFVEMKNIGSTIKKKIKLLRSIIGRYSEGGVTRELKAISYPTQKSLKIKLTPEEVAKIEALVLPEDDIIAAVRDIFLLQIYLRGIRVGDLLQAYSRDFKDERFTYSADKTDKTLTIKLIPKAQEIVEKYSGKHDRLFPLFTWKPIKGLSDFENERARLKHKETCTTIVNKHLKVIAGMCGIDKPLSSHIARHTFARMAIDKINNPMITMELLGHSSLAVHQAYLNDIRRDDVLDKAADDIFG